MNIPGKNILIDNLVAAKIHLDNFSVLVRGAPINFLPPFSTSTSNGNSFLYSGANIGHPSGYTEGINPLVSGSDVDSANDSIESVSSIGKKSSTNIMTKIIYFGLNLGKIDAFQISTSFRGGMAVIKDTSYDFCIDEIEESVNNKIFNMRACSCVCSSPD